LRLAELFDGGYAVEGYLDPVGGATLKTALHGLLGPRRKDDKRTPGQRRAYGLVELATRVLDSGTLPVRGGERPHLTITATLEADEDRPPQRRPGDATVIHPPSAGRQPPQSPPPGWLADDDRDADDRDDDDDGGGDQGDGDRDDDAPPYPLRR